ncbi:MAG TPA: ABC transporter permease [Chloroflexota bacterium]|nr:ABC transporter permease [Chloroflexota bacterium]
MMERRNPVTTSTSIAWRIHGLLRLIWSPQAPCPIPRRRSTADDSWWTPAKRNFLRTPALYLGVALIAMIAVGAVVVPLFCPYTPDQILPNSRLLPPNATHPFGTDALGRDLLIRVAAGAWLAARIAVMSVGISLAIGLILGSLAGYYSGWTDQLISRAMDGWLSLPGALVAIVIVARLGASLDNLILALGFMGVPAFYRIVRNTTLSARHMPYAEAAIALGADDRRVMWRHVFPNILSPVVVLTSMRMGTALLTGSGLSFIGLGAQPPLPEWGALMSAGRNYLNNAWWLALFPGIAVTCTVVGLNLLGDGLRDLLDPRMGRSLNSD